MHKELSGGLILRSLSEGHESDRARLPDFYAAVNTEGESEHVQEGLRLWTRELMEGHPTVTPDDIFVVVDPAKDDLIASATLLIPQTWRYEEIPFVVGRPELVGTLPDYRGRGLVRALFEAVHERSAALDHMVQSITGIPYFYRQFGYTMAIDLGEHAVFQLSPLKDPAPESQPAYTLRAATAEDVPAMLHWLDHFARERLVTDLFSVEMLRREIDGRNPGYFPHSMLFVITDSGGEGVGFVALLDSLSEPWELRCPIYVVGEKASYLATFSDVVQAIKVWATGHYGRSPEMLSFGGGIHETLDHLIDRSHGGLIRRREYSWYLRVPEPIRFLKHIGPILERRLAGSGAHRYTGELRIGFFTLRGISLQFEEGRLRDVAPISGKDGYDVEFPWHLFWTVVFGHRTADEILPILPEVWANAKAAVLLEILFPRKKSFVLGLT